MLFPPHQVPFASSFCLKDKAEQLSLCQAELQMHHFRAGLLKEQCGAVVGEGMRHPPSSHLYKQAQATPGDHSWHSGCKWPTFIIQHGQDSSMTLSHLQRPFSKELSPVLIKAFWVLYCFLFSMGGDELPPNGSLNHFP